MEIEETEDREFLNCEESHTACSAVNNLILDYYKKFGRKRDLEQFFSLSTAQSEVRDPCSLFWRRMKTQDESSDSGGRKSESSTELCRISIKCSIPESSSSQVEQSRVKSDSESPPIISEEIISEHIRNSDNESVKSDDAQSQKSIDGTLDISTNKPHSPTSSITSQRKLEWDSLADVGYANESDRKNSASSLSTLERMALQQQYSYNDTKNTGIGPPTAQSTPFEPNEAKQKNKKGAIKKSTKIYQKDIDSVELSIPQNTEIKLQPINLNLTKHISFNVDRNGSVLIENMTKNLSLSPEKVSAETEVTPQIKMDKEIQTTCSSGEKVKQTPQVKRYPVLISLNTLKKKSKKKKLRRIKRQQSKTRLIADKENIPLEKSGDQLSEAESFEYMPGHIYNQNHMKNNQRKNNVVDNKSSLESSGLTTDSSKTTKYSFTKDLEKSIDILKSALDLKYEDASLRKNLIKDIVHRLVESKYKSDKSSTELLSGLSFNSQRLGLGNHNYTTTSTSDTNNTANETKQSKPKKSILRMDKFNTNPIASTSQSVPNIPIFTKNAGSIESQIPKPINLSNTDSDISIKNKALSDMGMDKTSSEELYKKYLEALKREQAYKKHLKDKEMFLKHKLVSSDTAYNTSRQVETKAHNRIKDLMKDLVRNNYDDGSGDASKLEGGSSTYMNTEKYGSLRKQRSHSVFTLSSGNSENCCKNGPFANRHQNEAFPAGSSKNNSKNEKHFCCCPLHAHPKVGFTDSSVQVNIKSCRDNESPDRKLKESSYKQPKVPETETSKCERCKSPRNRTQIACDGAADDFKYVCLCTDEGVMPHEMPEKFLIYKCSRLPSKSLKLENIVSNNIASGSSSNFTSPRQKISSFKSQDCERKCLVIKDSNSSNNNTSKSSQTNLKLPIDLRPTRQQSVSSSNTECRENVTDKTGAKNIKSTFIHEATRSIQTEISIDPKISDPSLSDINIINDKNCEAWINEQYKKNIKPIFEKNINTKLDKNCVHMQSSESSSHENKRNSQTECGSCKTAREEEELTTVLPKVDKEVQYFPDHISNNDIGTVKDKQCSNNFTIPIQGTNMTLKVSLGSEIKSSPIDENKASKNNSTFKSKGTATINPSVVENATSLEEECSKAVQSSNTKIFEDIYQKPPKATCCDSRKTYKDNFDSQIKNNEKSRVFPESGCVNACLTDCKYNTYPTENRSNIQKPLLRCNTDPSKIDKGCHVTFNQKPINDAGYQPDVPLTPRKQSKAISTEQEKAVSCCSEISSKSTETSCKSKVSSDTDKQSKSSCSKSDVNEEAPTLKDPVLDIIQDITKRYSKKDNEKSKRKKCFKEIITVLSYLLDTEESVDHNQNKASSSSACDDVCESGETLPENESTDCIPAKTLVDKAVQLSTKKSKVHGKTCIESSDLLTSTDFPSTSSDAATCKVLNKIKRECDKYHQKRCKCGGGKNCQGSSSTSVNCDQCRHMHHCSCRGHKCKGHRAKTTVDKTKKRCLAYNLIIQTSDSVVSEEMNCGNNRRQLQNIIVKVPSKRKVENVPFQEMATKIESNMPHCSPRCNTRGHRSKSLPNDSEISSTDEIIKMAQDYTVREFLEKNRPDFIQKCSNRQDCLKSINKTRQSDGCTSGLNMIVVHPPTCNGNSCMETCNMSYRGIAISKCNACAYNNVHCVQNEVTKVANERAAKRQLLSLQLDRQQALNALSESELKELARALGEEMRKKKVAPKFISEREMKKHSEKIYKLLPEVVQKKEDIKKENIKKTNLLMANIFKKNLQKKTLRGAINISNYSSVIKI